MLYITLKGEKVKLFFVWSVRKVDQGDEFFFGWELLVEFYCLFFILRNTMFIIEPINKPVLATTKYQTECINADSL